MKTDISAYQVEIYQLDRENEELVAYMNPTPEQKAKIQKNCARIAYLALKMYDFYRDDPK